MSPDEQGIAGRLATLYDVFVDWPGRLARELPGLLAILEDADARRILDVGCGTGRHVRALLDRGLDAHGADVSEAMLDQAREHVGDGKRLHGWRLGDPPPSSVADAGPYDAVTCLGNVWPSLVSDADVDAALAAIRGLLRPGGVFVLAARMLAAHREASSAYLPLLRREHEGDALFFCRFVDVAVGPTPEGVAIADLHMAVLRGDASGETRCEVHEARRMRMWAADELAGRLEEHGLAVRRRARSLADPDAPATGDDALLVAHRT